MGTNGSIPSTLASLILIDRQLDVVTPALHQAHVLDRIFGSLPARGCSTHGRSQSASGRTSEVANTALGQQDQSSVHEVFSTEKQPREAGAEPDASAADGGTEVEARADGGSNNTEGVSEAADEGSLEAADESDSGAANEGWSDMKEAPESELSGVLQPGTAEREHQAQQQEQHWQHQQHHQQPQQPQKTMSSLRQVLQACKWSD